MIDWQRIKIEYITDSKTSYRKLAKKYGVSTTQICNVGNKEHWAEQREQHLNKTVTKTIEMISEKKVDRAAKILDASDILLRKVIERVEAMDALDMQSQEFRHLSATIKDIKEIQMIRSDADILEQEARIANLRKQANMGDGNKPTLIIEGMPEEFKR